MKVFARVVLFILVNSSISGAYSQDAVAITQEMFSVVKSFRSIQFHFDSKARINGKMFNEVTNFKIQVNPYKVYIYQQHPKKGIEGLYVTGENDGKMKINPNAFPWVTLNLDPEGDLMLDNRHHSIFNAGYTYTISILEDLVKKYQTQISKLITLNADEKIHGQECYHLTLINPNYKLTLYNTIADETPISVAKKLKISYYTILENNPGYKATSKFKTGTRLIVPNDYATRMEIYIHKNKLYPVYLKIYDAKGLFEEFTFMDVVINPVFKHQDFSASNPAYKF